MGPKEARSTDLSREDEVIIVAFRRHTLLPLDDCLYSRHCRISPGHPCTAAWNGTASVGCPSLRATSPTSSASRAIRSAPSTSTSPRACPREGGGQHGGRQAALVRDHRPHDQVRVRSPRREHWEDGGGSVASRDFIKAAPYRIHTVLTDNGIQFTSRKQDVWDSQHIFNRVCGEHDIEHRLTKVNHPWTNGQVERMNRTLKSLPSRRRGTPRSSATTMTPTTSSGRTCNSSWRPTTMPDGSRHFVVSRPTTSSARPGPKSPIGSGSIRHTSSRDRTAEDTPGQPRRGRS